MSIKQEVRTEEVVGRPWPYRKDDEPLPVFCARCGRGLLPYAWCASEPYLELACAGRLQWLCRFSPFRGWLFTLHHYQFTVGRGQWNQFDVLTGKRNRLPYRF